MKNFLFFFIIHSYIFILTSQNIPNDSHRNAKSAHPGFIFSPCTQQCAPYHFFMKPCTVTFIKGWLSDIETPNAILIQQELKEEAQEERYRLWLSNRDPNAILIEREEREEQERILQQKEEQKSFEKILKDFKKQRPYSELIKILYAKYKCEK